MESATPISPVKPRNVWMERARARQAQMRKNRAHKLAPTTDATIWRLYFSKVKPTGKYYVYLLLLRDGSHYVGMTQNLIARLLRHKLGKGAMIVQRKGYKRLLETWTLATKEQAIIFEQHLTVQWHRFGIVYGGLYCGRTYLDRGGYSGIGD